MQDTRAEANVCFSSGIGEPAILLRCLDILPKDTRTSAGTSTANKPCGPIISAVNGVARTHSARPYVASRIALRHTVRNNRWPVSN